jgi:type IV pilus assembly protein PilQ
MTARAVTRAHLAPARHTRSGDVRSWMAAVAMLLCLSTGLAPLAAHAEESTNTLDSIEFSGMPGDRVQVVLTLAGPAPEPLAFSTDNPARLALDLPATTNRIERRMQTIGLGMARSLNIAEAQGRTRVVLNLVQVVPYDVRVDGHQVVLTLEGRAAPTGGVANSLAAERAAWTNSARRVNNVDFRRGERGEARVQIRLSDPSIPVDMRQEGGNIVLDVMHASVPEALERRLDVTDFATPVRMIDTFAHGNNVRLVVTPTGDYEHLAYQAQDLFTLEVKPLTREDLERGGLDQPTFNGERLSLNFQNIEVRAVLQLIADFTDFNVVVSDSVGGNMTLRLENVPWDQALDIILKTRGLGMRQNGNVILIAPNEEITAREQQEMRAQQHTEELAPLRSEFIQINYAKASELAALMRSPEHRLLSERGNVTHDERTNTLLLHDTEERLADARRLVARLDVPVRQVLIESRIVIATDDFGKELGVRFGATAVRRGGDSIATTGGVAGTDTMVRTPNLQDQRFPTGLPALGDRLNVNLPTVSDPAGRIAFAILGADYLVDLELAALQAEGRGEIVSNPRVITANQREASIKQGFEVPYVTPSTVGAPATVSFKEALLSLAVTPQITPDENIIMDLRINRDNPDFTRSVQGNPPLEKREIITSVAVRNGETVVLGGVFEHSRQELRNKVPVLGDLPIIGHAFRNRLDRNERRELLVFVTPKIVQDGMALH